MEKVLGMKPCKECGKLFRPKSAKSIYCDGEHYRPCPVCGKLVYAKYLSDPARCCSGTCKSKLGKLNKEDAHVAEGMKQRASDLGIEVPEIEAINVVEPTPEVVAYAEADVKTVQEVHEVYSATEESIRKRYEGPSTNGWNEGHEYAVFINYSDKQYVVQAAYDYTTQEMVHLKYTFTNKKKISTIFKAVR